MEMLYGGCGAMFLGWYVARKWFKLNDVGTIVVMTIAGGGSLITGLIYLWLADVNIGNDRSSRDGSLNKRGLSAWRGESNTCANFEVQ